MTRNLLFALGLAGYAAGAAGDYVYNANTGALSYTFFNLSPYTNCSFVPYGSAANPAALNGYLGQTDGWNAGAGWVGFFNSALGGSHSDTLDYYIFWDQEDPVTSASPAVSALDTGEAATTVEFSSSFGSSENPPAIADSWTLTCTGATGTSLPDGSAIVIANVASASNLLESGNSSTYPYSNSWNGSFYNASLNPPSPGYAASTTNPNGMGFTPGTMNFNQANGTVGGLWSGVNNPNAFAANAVNAAMYPLNLAAYVENPVADSIGKTAAPLWGGHFTLAVGDPFLVSSYAAKTLWYLIIAPGQALQNSSLDTNGLNDMADYLVAGGQSDQAVFTNASPSNDYLQWLLASPGQAATTIQTLDTAADTPITKTSIWGKIFSSLLQVTTDALVAGIAFVAGPEASVALQVGVAAATGAATDADGALMPMATSAIDADFTSTVSQPPPVAATAPPVINATYSSSNLLGMLLANSFVQAQIDNTMGRTPSVSPLWSNYAISSDGLCSGITLTSNLLSAGNCGSQSGTQGYINVLSTYPNSVSTTQLSIWDAILTGADITATNGWLQVANPASAAFSPPVQLVNNTGQTTSITNSVNVTFNNNSGLLSLVSYGTTATGDPTGQGPTSPPTNLPYIYCNFIPSPENGNSCSIAGVSYDSTTGVLTATQYDLFSSCFIDGEGGSILSGVYPFSNGTQTIDLTECVADASVELSVNPGTSAGSLSCQPSFPVGSDGSYTAASTPPPLTVVVPMPGGNTYQIGAPNVQDAAQVGYDASTGLLTVNGYLHAATFYSFQNGTQTLNTTACPTGTAVLLSVYPIGDNATQAQGFLSCQGQPTLPYGLCVGDPQATGGVVAALMTQPAADGSGATFDLGCVCIPSYLGGPAAPDPTNGSSLLGGVLVGARAAYPNAQCD
ncbi:hypothetical protein [Candidatus Thiodictyon syntrophicum]|jgi:hypothetical protein|uniref:Uncharacterized protein n=1 Tax=Candidatus Thiodictyon syntrophicum TaxID=1166950 RepID=A0A2K8U9L5_9GAMM|nr:hypothetical protein [Candidatus Thiodictyon syntrophicum]AUB82227.1 hypothetical protein THSYN_15575 [Candidatus Thiodictyon syntrophicum]